MNKWSLKQTSEISKDMADFIEKRIESHLAIMVDNKDLYKAVIYMNLLETGAFISVVRTPEDKQYLIIRSNTDKYDEILKRLHAMHNHHKEVIRNLRPLV
tara:strand:- start:121 stop:420 length:300 start_codon:yes stop_codon:yes gene_type:complete